MAKVKTFEEAQEDFNASKEALKTAKTELREFMVENKIKKDKAPEDPKILAKYEKLVAKSEKAQEVAEAAKEAVKELKPKKERDTKYAYPEGMTDKDKKKFRAAERRKLKNPEKAAKADKGEAAAKPAKKSLKKDADAGEGDED
jgi:hypothetical protein